MIDILSHQRDFILSDNVHTGLVGGFRSGKSEAGVIKSCKKKMSYPGIDTAYYLPTYGLIKDIAYPKFETYLQKFGVDYVLNKSDHEFQTPYGRIILRSMDNPDTIVGYEVGYSLIDEADILSLKHMNNVLVKVVARLSVPLPDGLPNSLDFVSTPEGFKFLYDFFVKKPHENKILIRAKTENNPFISESYIETLRMNYTEQQLNAYLNGEFVNLTSGSVYHKYDRIENHTDEEIQRGDVLHIGMDFNVQKMAAVIHVVRNRRLHAVAEIIDAYDTTEISEIIKERYSGHSIVIYPDASGNARKTAATDTDIQILKKNRFRVMVDSTNPSVKERITVMNLAFCDNKGERNYFVNVNNCPAYADALEQLAYKNDVPDKTSGFDHVTEAAGYCVFQHNKLKKGHSIRIRG